MPNKEFIVRNGLIVGNTTSTYLTANSSGLYGNGAGITSVSSANNASYLNGNTAATLRTYSETKANTAYNDAVSYASSTATSTYNNAVNYAISVSNTAYNNAVSYAASIATIAYSNAVSFSSNATNLTNGTVPAARLSGSYTILASNSTLATKASTLSQGGGTGTAMTFSYAGQSGQPTYLWGTNDGTNMYVWSPSNFSVNYATSAGNSDTVDGYHAASFARYAAAADFTGRVTGRGQSSGDVGVIGYSGVSTSYNGYVGYSTYSFYGTGDCYISGQILATSNITAYYSDKRLKTNITPISSPLQKLLQLNGVYFIENDLAKSFGYNNDNVQIGVIAQEVQKIIPDAVSLAPFDIEMVDGRATSKSGENYLTVKYEKLVPLLIEAIKELKQEVDELKGRIGE